MQHSNGYIIGFSAAVCIVCGFLVALSATALKERQDLNVLLDRQKNVLAVAGLVGSDETLSASEIGARFEKAIRPRVIELATGETDSGTDPRGFDQRKASRDPATSTAAPVNTAKVNRLPNQALIYEVMKQGEVESLILPIEGYGLWSVLYGYLALDKDARTIRGLTYYEHGETAGLGGEVDNPRWKAKWVGRKAFDERGSIKIQVKKGSAGSVAEDPYQVDGLAGATLTSRGVTNMLRFWLGKDGFGPYLDRYREKRGT